MGETHSKPPKWLSIREASALLRISASTLRRWSDKYTIPSSKTPGGHRRYDRDAIEKLAEQLGNPSIPAQTVASPSIPLPNCHVPEECLGVQPWRAHLAPPDDTENTMRALGQRVLGLLIQYITRDQDDPRFLDEAHELGARHGMHAARYGASLLEAIEAFTFFRNTFSQISLQIPQVSHGRDCAEIVRFTTRIGQFMDKILLGLVFGYETKRGTRPRDRKRGSRP